MDTDDSLNAPVFIPAPGSALWEGGCGEANGSSASTRRSTTFSGLQMRERAERRSKREAHARRGGVGKNGVSTSGEIESSPLVFSGDSTEGRRESGTNDCYGASSEGREYGGGRYT